jgi:hypothetical protein
MTRIVRTPNGVFVDPSGKMPGRGAYLHDLQSCWEAGIKSSLGQSLNTKLTPEDIERLKSYMASLSDLEENQGSSKTDA